MPSSSVVTLTQTWAHGTQPTLDPRKSPSVSRGRYSHCPCRWRVIDGESPIDLKRMTEATTYPAGRQRGATPHSKAMLSYLQLNPLVFLPLSLTSNIAATAEPMGGIPTETPHSKAMLSYLQLNPLVFLPLSLTSNIAATRRPTSLRLASQ